jgi:hypothetical protein
VPGDRDWGKAREDGFGTISMENQIMLPGPENVDMKNRIPNMFLWVALIMLCMQVVGTMIIFTRVESAKKSHGITWKEAFKTTTIYGLIGFAFLIGIAACYVQAVTKNISAYYNVPDSWATGVNMVSSVVNGMGRIMWGGLNDAMGFKFSMTLCSVVLCTSMVLSGFVMGWVSDDTASEATDGTKWTFMLFWCFFNMLVCAIFVLMPAATAHYFGAKYTTDIYGFIFAGYGCASVVLALTNNCLADLMRSVAPWLTFMIIGCFAGGAYVF